MVKKNLFGGDVPLGLGMAMAQNAEALKKFSEKKPEEQRWIIEGTHNIGSPEEMRLYVRKIADGKL